MATAPDPDLGLDAANPCGIDIGRGFKQIIRECLKDPNLFIDIHSLGFIYELADWYSEHRSKTHYAIIGDEMISSSAGDDGHHTTTTGDRTEHADLNSFDTTVKKRTVTNENYDVLTEFTIFMQSVSRFLRATEEIVHYTKYHTHLSDERTIIASGEAADEWIKGLSDGRIIKRLKDDERIIFTTRDKVKIGGKEVVIHNPVFRHCEADPSVCCYGAYPTCEEVAGETGADGEPYTPVNGQSPLDYNFCCLAETMTVDDVKNAVKTSQGVDAIGLDRIQETVDSVLGAE